MTRALSSTLPSARPAPPPLPRQVRHWLQQELPRLRDAITRSADACAADAQRKHFTAIAHAGFLLFHALSRSPSLRQSYASLPAYRGLVCASGLARPAVDDERLAVSFSQLALSNTTRPAAFLAGILPVLSARLERRADLPLLPPDLQLLDATFLYVSATLAPWVSARSRAHTSGVKLHLTYQPLDDLPSPLVISDSRVPDCRSLDQGLLADPEALATAHGQTWIMDLGYYSHERFARLRQAGVHFLTRLQPQAHVVVTAEQPLQRPLALPGRPAIAVLADQQVTVGSATNRAGAVLVGLRLVTASVAPQPAAARQGQTAVVYRILTDRWDLEAATVVLAYRWRWQIELFFRWLKTHLTLGQLLGHSANAVALSVWLALLVHLLLLLLAQHLALPGRSPALRALLAAVFVTLPWSSTPASTACPRQLVLPWSHQPP